MTRKQITNVLKYKHSTKNQMNAARKLSMRGRRGGIRMKTVYNTHKRNRKQKARKTCAPPDCTALFDGCVADSIAGRR